MNELSINYKSNASWLERKREILRQVSFPINGYFSVITEPSKRRHRISVFATYSSIQKARVHLVKLYRATNNPLLKRLVASDLRWIEETNLLPKISLVGVPNYHVSDVSSVRRAALAKTIAKTGNDKNAALRVIAILMKHQSQATELDIKWLQRKLNAKA